MKQNNRFAFSSLPRIIGFSLPLSLRRGGRGARLLLALTLLSSHSHAQPLTINSKVPDITIGSYINNPSKKIRLHDIRASLILLGFFDSGCSACIHDLRSLDSLQKIFGNKVKLINITKEDPSILKATFARFKWNYPSSPLLVADKNLLKLFPYKAVPHHVWLDSSYTVRYITIGQNATAENFNAFLNNEKLPLVTKFDLEDFDESQPLWLEGNGRLYDQLQYYSFIMKKIIGYNGSLLGRVKDKTRNTVGFKAYNIPLLSIIKAAWEEYPTETFENNNRVAIEVSDPSVFTPPRDPNLLAKWLEQNAWCYVLSMPDSKKEDLFKTMQQDISRYFDYDITIQKRRTPCFVLVRTSANDKIKSTGVYIKKTRPETDSIIIQKGTFANFIKSLNNPLYRWPKPVIDETAYAGRIDLRLGCWYNETEKLKIELRKYDLDLIEEDRTIDILVIKDKEKGSR